MELKLTNLKGDSTMDKFLITSLGLAIGSVIVLGFFSYASALACNPKLVILATISIAAASAVVGLLILNKLRGKVSSNIENLKNGLLQILEGRLDVRLKPEAMEKDFREVANLFNDVSALIRKRENILRQMLDNSGIGIRVIDKNYNILNQNVIMDYITGLQSGKIQRGKCYETTTWNVCHTDNCPVKRALETGECVEDEITLIRTDGTKIPYKVVATPLRDESGNIYAVVESLIDISEIKEREEYIRIIENKIRQMEEDLKIIEREVVESADKITASSNQLLEFVKSVNVSSEQVSTTMQEITKGAIQQSTKLEEVSNVIIEMNKAANEMAKKAENVAEFAKKAGESAKEGSKAAEKATIKMEEIHDSIVLSAELVKSLEEKSRKIGEIVKVISNIADQTNLLALNAAIEAARAGEAGRGFAVVADEVRKLAEESAKAAEQIGEIIHDIETSTGSTAESMTKSVEKLNEGGVIIQNALKSLEYISKEVTEVSNEIGDVAVLAKNQAEATEKISDTIHEISALAQENSAGAEEVSAAMDEIPKFIKKIYSAIRDLDEMSKDLKKIVKVSATITERR